MSMSTLCSTPAERARKAYSRVLQSLQDPGTQRNVAQVLGVSESTVSRIKTDGVTVSNAGHNAARRCDGRGSNVSPMRLLRICADCTRRVGVGAPDAPDDAPMLDRAPAEYVLMVGWVCSERTHA